MAAAHASQSVNKASTIKMAYGNTAELKETEFFQKKKEGEEEEGKKEREKGIIKQFSILFRVWINQCSLRECDFHRFEEFDEKFLDIMLTKLECEFNH
jgi:hypothetical protein